MSVQLAFVAGLVALFCFETWGMKEWVRANRWVYWISYAVFLVTYLTLACCSSVRRKFPSNFICLVLLTISIAYMTAMISSFYNTKMVFIAMGICAACSISISLFAINTKYDFTSCIGVMFVVFMVLFFIGIFAIFFHSEKLYMVYAGGMALVFMVYLAIDTQMLIGGKKHELDPEEYIFAATQLFLDIIYIFWFILQILGYVNRS